VETESFHDLHRPAMVGSVFVCRKVKVKALGWGGMQLYAWEVVEEAAKNQHRPRMVQGTALAMFDNREMVAAVETVLYIVAVDRDLAMAHEMRARAEDIRSHHETIPVEASGDEMVLARQLVDTLAEVTSLGTLLLAVEVAAMSFVYAAAI